MAHYIAQQPVYTCTCTRFTGIPNRHSPLTPKGTGASSKEVVLPRTDYCKHVLAVMRVTGDPRYIAPPPPTMPLDHPLGNIRPHEMSTYSDDYKGGKGRPSKAMEPKLWGTSEMERKKRRAW